jgi:hypothetical protein
VVEEERVHRESLPSEIDQQQTAPEDSKAGSPQDDTDLKKVIDGEAAFRKLNTDEKALESRMKQQEDTLEKLKDELTKDMDIRQVIASEAALPKLALEVLKAVFTKDEMDRQKLVKDEIAGRRKRGGNEKGGTPSTPFKAPERPPKTGNGRARGERHPPHRQAHRGRRENLEAKKGQGGP